VDLAESAPARPRLSFKVPEPCAEGALQRRIELLEADQIGRENVREYVSAYG
jgi:hypothetical protein